MWVQEEVKLSIAGIAAILIAFAILGCVANDSPTQKKYETIASLPDSLKRKSFDQLTPTEKVDVYLFGVENYQPSDYFLAEYFEGSDRSTFEALRIRLKSSTS